MAEIRGRAVLGSGYAYRPLVAEYGILRGISTGAARRAPALSAEDRKENIPPKGQQKAPARRSPLPSWYPRTPLRDITAIVNAIERQRSHLRATRSQINNRIQVSPAAASPVSVLEQEPSRSESSLCSSPQSVVSVTATASASRSPPSVTSTFESTANAVVSPADLNNKEVIKEPTTHAAETTTELNDKKKVLEELECAVKEHLKSVPKLTLEQPRRRTLLMLR